MKNIKGAGRKPVEDQNRRVKNVRVRLSQKEFEQICQLHHKTRKESISGLIRTVLFKEKIQVKVANKELQWLAHDLSELSSQIAKLLRAKSPKVELLGEKIIEFEGNLGKVSALLENLSLTVSGLEDFNTVS